MIDSPPHISVLLPCHNAENTLDEALYSLETQTYADFEVLAVDDGSADHTAAMLREWTRRDSRFRVFSSDHKGIVGALQRAASHAVGTLIARMDADDVAHPRRLERQVAYLDAHTSLAGCGTAVRYIPADQVRDGARRYERWINSLVSPEEIERDLFVECPIPHPTLVLRKEVFDAIGGYRDVAWPEDYDLVLRLWEAGHRLGKVPEVLLDWRESADRASRTDPRYSEEAFRRCKIEFIGKRIDGRRVVVNGAGPVGKLFARALLEAGHTLAAFVDVDPRKIGQQIHGVPVIRTDELESYSECYLLAAVGSDRARADIRTDLDARGFTEIDDYCAVA